jgi:hypothetical protein
MAEKYRFRILVLDTKGDCVIKSEQQLLYATAAHGDLWKKAEIKNVTPPHLIDEGCSLTGQPITPDADLDDAFVRAFEIELAGTYEAVEKRRLGLLRHYKHQRFDLVYILRDEVSEYISRELYPLLYKVENALRGYLLRFMVTRLGPSWWDVTAKAEYGMKIIQRKNNETNFAEHVDVKAYLVDFGDLGKLVYSHSSGFSTKEDIVRQIAELDETPEAIKSFKEQLQSNYQKFFRATFKDKGFQEKWEKFEKIRHKIAHTSLFTANDLTEGKQLATDLCSIIQAAESNAPSLELPVEEKQAIRESFILRTNAWSVISETDFVTELRTQQAYFATKGGFVGLAHFVKFHLGAKGFDFAASYTMAETLNAKGAIEIYEVEGSLDGTPIKAIRIKDASQSKPKT